MSPQELDRDRRGFPRIPKEFSVEVSKLYFPLSEESEEIGSGKNISGGGICLSVSRQYGLKTVLSLKIKIVGWQEYKSRFSKTADISSEDAITAVGEVVWSRELTDVSGYEIGIKFVKIYEDDYQAFIKYLEKSS